MNPKSATMQNQFPLTRIKMPSRSVVTVASLDDLLIEILLRLPMESLRRFKLVSKHWLSLITNPQLWIRRNLRKRNPASGTFFFRPTFWGDYAFKYVPFHRKLYRTPASKTLDFTEEIVGINIVQSSNGLLLCSSKCRVRRDNEKYYVYNPTTKQFTTLPELVEEPGFYMSVIGMSLAFDDNHYKVVCVYYQESLHRRGFLSESSRPHFHIQVYSPESRTWTKFGDPFNADVNFIYGVYSNGAVHWIGHGVEGALYFDVRRRVLEKMPNPPRTDDDKKHMDYYFGESCNHLHFVEYRGSAQFTVYELKKDHSEWFVLYQVDISNVASKYPKMTFTKSDGLDCHEFSVISVIRGRKEAKSFLLLRIPGMVVKYKLKSNCFQKLVGCRGRDPMDVYTYGATFRISKHDDLMDTWGFGGGEDDIDDIDDTIAFMDVKSLSRV